MGPPVPSRKLVKFGLLVAAPLLLATPTNPAEMRLIPRQVSAADWMEFDTDACGSIGGLENRHTAAGRLRAGDPDDEEDDGGFWGNMWNLSPAESAQLNDWLIRHPEIALVSNTVEKSCDDEQAPIDDHDALELA